VLEASNDLAGRKEIWPQSDPIRWPPGSRWSVAEQWILRCPISRLASGQASFDRVMGGLPDLLEDPFSTET